MSVFHTEVVNNMKQYNGCYKSFFAALSRDDVREAKRVFDIFLAVRHSRVVYLLDYVSITPEIPRKQAAQNALLNKLESWCVRELRPHFDRRGPTKPLPKLQRPASSRREAMKIAVERRRDALVVYEPDDFVRNVLFDVGILLAEVIALRAATSWAIGVRAGRDHYCRPYMRIRNERGISPFTTPLEKFEHYYEMPDMAKSYVETCRNEVHVFRTLA